MLEATGRIRIASLMCAAKTEESSRDCSPEISWYLHGKQYFLTLMVDLPSANTPRRRCASQERFKAIADYTVDLEAWFGPDGRLLWVNPRSDALGFTVPELWPWRVQSTRSW